MSADQRPESEDLPELTRPVEALRQRRLPDFGGWEHNVTMHCIVHHHARLGSHYAICLEDCSTCAEVLNWIMQVAGKRWATDEVLAGLVRIFNHVLHPQATMCSGGRDQQYSPAQHAAQRTAEG